MKKLIVLSLALTVFVLGASAQTVKKKLEHTTPKSKLVKNVKSPAMRSKLRKASVEAKKEGE